MPHWIFLRQLFSLFSLSNRSINSIASPPEPINPGFLSCNRDVEVIDCKLDGRKPGLDVRQIGGQLVEQNLHLIAKASDRDEDAFVLISQKIVVGSHLNPCTTMAGNSIETDKSEIGIGIGKCLSSEAEAALIVDQSNPNQSRSQNIHTRHLAPSWKKMTRTVDRRI